MNAVNWAKTPYKALDSNSNSFGGTLFERLTGQGRPTDSNYPALANDLCDGEVKC